MRAAGGVYADTNEPRTFDTLLIGPLTDLVLSLNAEAKLRRVELILEQVEQDGKVRFQAEGAAQSLNPGHQTIVDVFNALGALAESGSHLGCLVYSDEVLDIYSRVVLWRTLAHHLPRIGLGSIQKLVIVVRTPELQVSTYLAHDCAIVCQLDNSGFRTRKRFKDNRLDIAQISGAGTDQPLILFLGAGVSISSGLPLGNELRDMALREVVDPKREKGLSDLPTLFEEFVRVRERFLDGEDRTEGSIARMLTLERVLVEEIRLKGGVDYSSTLRHLTVENDKAKGTVGKAIRDLAKIIAAARLPSNRRVIILTVNFDTLLETRAGENLQVFKSDDDFIRAPEEIAVYLKDGGKVPYLKLHGSLEELRTVVATIDKTRSGLSGPKRRTIKSLVSSQDPTPWVYVGCSMRDLDLNQVFNSPDFSSQVDEWWVAPLVDRSVREFASTHRTWMWEKEDRRSLDERMVTETADTFFTVLLEMWRG